MIYYRPTDGDPLTQRISYCPKTCFIMTQLGKSVSSEIISIRSSLNTILSKYAITTIDAGSKITGRDFLLKIWKMIITVPLGIAIITRNMPRRIMNNIYYEIGLLQAYGKETLVIKTQGTKIPSDFIRTEYVDFGSDFESQLEKYLDYYLGLPDYFDTMADGLENDPLLAIDYYRRAYLISGDTTYRGKAKSIFSRSLSKTRSSDSVEMLLMNF